MTTFEHLVETVLSEYIRIVSASQPASTTWPDSYAPHQRRVMREAMATALMTVYMPSPPEIDGQFIDDKYLWSLRTFGPGRRENGVTDHIIKEAVEARDNPTDASEWADIILLAMDGASRAQITGNALIEAINAKQAKNQARQWPDWRSAAPDKAIEHIRDREGE